MKVRVKCFTTLRELIGSSEEQIEIESESVLADLLENIAQKYGKEAQDYLYHQDKMIDPSIYFLVNGVNSRVLSGTKTRLKEGDVIAIIPPIGGG